MVAGILRAALLALLPLGAALDAGAEGGAAAAEREWTTRAWALEPERASELLAAARSERWERRALALEAAARSVAVDGWAAGSEAVDLLAREALGDPHPTVRERALALLARGRGLEGITPGRLEPARRDPLPEGRRALARALAATPPAASAPATEARRALWGELVRDPDPTVAAAAQRAVWSAPDLAELEELAADLWSAMDAGAGELASAAAVLAAGPGGAPPPLPRSLGARLEWIDVARPDAARRRAHLELVRLARNGTAELERVLAGGLHREGATDEERALLRAVSRGAGAPWARALVAEAARLDLAGSDADALDLCLELAASAAGGAAALTLAAEHRWSPTGTRRLADVLGDEVRDWDPARASSWLARAEEAGAALTWVRTFAPAAARGDTGVLPALRAALASPSAPVRDAAFRALGRAPRPELAADALLAAWEAAPRALRLEWLASAPRGLAAFRDALVELGEEGGRARRLAAEHLRELEGDARAAEVLRRWFEEARGAWVAGGAEAERELVGAARALAQVDGRAALGPLAELLVRAAPASGEVGKNVAALLGESESGRERLARAFADSERWLPRVRTEAALVLAARGDAPSAAHLAGELGRLAPDLRTRVVRALGASRLPEALELLEALVLDPRGTGAAWSAGPPGVALQAAAIDALARAGRPEALLRLADDAHTPESRANALLALRGYPHAAIAEELVARVRARRAERGGGVLAGDVRALLVDSALLALARTGHVPGAFLPEVLAAPLEAAEHRLLRRRRGRSHATVEFAFQAELALGARLAADGRLPELLAATPHWHRLDPGFLLLLADAAGDAPGAAELLRAAAVACLGETGEERAEAARARALLLARLDARGERERAERLARGLWLDRRTGELEDRAWRRVVRAAGSALDAADQRSW